MTVSLRSPSAAHEKRSIGRSQRCVDSCVEFGNKVGPIKSTERNWSLPDKRVWRGERHTGGTASSAGIPGGTRLVPAGIPQV